MHVLCSSVILFSISALFIEASLETNDSETPIPRAKSNRSKSGRCKVGRSLSKEIAAYQSVVNMILDEGLKGSFRGKTYSDLSYFVDKFGNRISGTQNLENSIDFMLQKMKNAGLANVHGEDALIPHWFRGRERARLLRPVQRELAILGLGNSVGTTLPLGIVAQAIVVADFEELKSRAAEVQGRIVVFNEEFVDYETTVEYRYNAASETAKLSGVAALVRSVTDFSIYSPHTGVMTYQDNVKKIPTACVTVEDAEMLSRIQQRNETIVISLKMEDRTLPDVRSRNAVGEIVGSRSPDDIVVVSGHIDSWDVGQGAMDDGGGAFVSVEALALLRHLKLTPRRTLRAILWTSEEMGLNGAKAYVRHHLSKIDSFKTVLESDLGTFKPLGIDVAGTVQAACIVKKILKLFKAINATRVRRMPHFIFDIDEFTKEGVPALSLSTASEKYFYFHHTDGDTMTVEKSDELDLCTAFYAAVAYVLADLSVDLPRK